MSVRTHSPTPILKYGRGTLLRFIDQKEPQKEDNGLISLEKLFGEDEDTQVNKLKRQVKEQGEKIELLQREISVLQNEKKSFFGFKRR